MANKYFLSYLENHKQFVTIDNCQSEDHKQFVTIDNCQSEDHKQFVTIDNCQFDTRVIHAVSLKAQF